MPWPENPRYFGKATPRAEAPAKVTGRAKFTTDVALPGMLFGAVLRAPWPAARVRAIELAKARSAPGIKAAVAVQDGAFDVRFYGQELAAVAGVSRQAVLDALPLIAVDAEPRPFVVDEIAAMQPDSAPVVAGKANLGEGQARTNGDVDTAFAASAAVVEGVYRTQVELHHCLEPHGQAVAWEGGELTAWVSTQGVFALRDGFARALGVPQSNVRVICEHMGGGFGAKSSLGAEGALCAKLAQAAGAPVKLILTRFEEALAVGNRPSSWQKIKMGADAAGNLTAFQLESFGTAGFGNGVNNGAGSGSAAFPAPYIYKFAASRVKQGSVAINAGQACAMRAPGHPIASAGIEAALDDLAAKLRLDPLELRLKNDPSETRRREYALGAEKFGWKEKYRAPGSSPGPVKVGIGCAGAAWNSGMSRNTQAEVQVTTDGGVEVRVGTQDLGTGSRTVIEVIAAEMFGLAPEQIAVRVGDTRFPPSGTSGGSQTTSSIAPAVYDACENALTELKKLSGLDDPRGANWKNACAKIGGTPLQVRGRWREGLAAGGGAINQGGVQFAEVEVDTETGFVKVRKILVVQDCGAVVNRLTCESQINGGVIMGLGYALYEQRIMDRASGVVLNPNFETYKLPGPADIPAIEIVLLEQPERGVIGVGEPCTVPTASAIANAVANAIGARVPDLPLTPDRVLAALGLVPATERGGARAEIDAAFRAVAQLPVHAGATEAFA
ncbi:MAG TPA: xanthine dehydrogenase family protein molybdopterin-binding subunit [Opitutaceae bacterium]|nr:xanthine dehydrogenase family protein molybdopterin-binding subunit [Opitutaceae bacterium]